MITSGWLMILLGMTFLVGLNMGALVPLLYNFFLRSDG